MWVWEEKKRRSDMEREVPTGRVSMEGMRGAGRSVGVGQGGDLDFSCTSIWVGGTEQCGRASVFHFGEPLFLCLLFVGTVLIICFTLKLVVFAQMLLCFFSICCSHPRASLIRCNGSRRHGWSD